MNNMMNDVDSFRLDIAMPTENSGFGFKVC